MFKTFLAIIGLFLINISSTFAGPFYIGAGAAYQAISIPPIRFIGATPRFFAGIGDVIVTNWTYLGVEVFASPFKALIMSEETSGLVLVPGRTSSLRPGYTYGVSVIPGIVLDQNVMAYARVSAMTTQFSTLEISRGGIQVGLGIEVCLCGPISIRGEYDYASYHSINVPVTDSGGTPKEDFYMISGVYRFG